jgi:cysteine desulfurase
LRYFDHNATTPVAPEVADVYAAALRGVPGNASSSHRAGQDARKQLEQSRLSIARVLNCAAQELVFTSGGTESNNLAIFGIACGDRSSRRHVVTTAMEHPAVLEPVRQLAREGCDVSFTGSLTGEIDAAIREETVLVSVMHANNETGAIQRIGEIAEVVRARRAAGQKIYLHSDGVQAFGKIPVDLERLGVDLYSISAHKIYGPKGIGALFVRKDTPIRAIQFGGRHERGRRPGTESVPGVMAFACACKLLAEYPAHELGALRDRFERQLLETLDDIEINAHTEDRLPNTSNVLFRGISGETMLIALDTAGFAVSTGSACSSGSIEPSHVLLAMGRSAAEARSSVRFSFGRSNTLHDVDQLADAVVGIVRRLRKSRERRPQLAAY